MIHKNLHIHATPLIVFVLLATVVSAVSVGSWRSQLLATGLLRPAIRLESTSHGYVKVMANKQAPVAEEQPGAVVEGLSLAGDRGVMRASQTANSVGLQLTLDNAIRPQ